MPHARYVCFQLVCTRVLQLRECYRVVTSCAATELVFSRNETSRSRMVSVQYVIRSILAAAMFRAIINSMDRSSFCVVSIHYLSSNTHPHKKKNNCSIGNQWPTWKPFNGVYRDNSRATDAFAKRPEGIIHRWHCKQGLGVGKILFQGGSVREPLERAEVKAIHTGFCAFTRWRGLQIILNRIKENIGG